MSYTFDEIMSYHKGNREVYQEIKENLQSIIPFVGAGLTAFAYPSWSKALEEIATKITKRKDVQNIKKLIKKKEYIEAAGELERLRTPINLERDLAHLFSAERLEQNRKELSKEPIVLLPYLFPNFVITTNFEETLETVYKESGHSFGKVFTPGSPEVLSQYLRKVNHCALFKIHGTITDGIVEYGKIVFTAEQYKRHYAAGAPLTKELKQCFEGKLMLFLGCSLQDDQTMKLLQEMIKLGVENYTIIDCKKSECDDKVGMLGEKRIRAIVYEHKRHEAVRVILEHLLEEINPDKYKELPVHIGALNTLKISNRFFYKADIVPFFGRESEMEALKLFLSDDHIAFRWWAITGPGGSGKSRLAYEFQRQLPSDWKTHYLCSSDYENLDKLSDLLTQKTLVIADYVQEHAKSLGKWMEQLAEKWRSLPLRLLLIERHSDSNPRRDRWIKQLYENVRYKNKLMNTCYQEKFLELKPLIYQNLKDIIDKYALAIQQENGVKKGKLSDDEQQMLLKKLKDIDPKLYRPLYAMFLTDAYVRGKNPERWSRKDVLDYVVDRECVHLDFTIRQIMQPWRIGKKLYKSCLYLQCTSTALKGLSLEELQYLCPEKWEIVEKESDEIEMETPESLLGQIGITEGNRIPALIPNLIGEYFVYRWLMEQSKKEAHTFLNAVWKNPEFVSAFFQRMICDYDDLFNKDEKHWEKLLPDDLSFQDDDLLYYAAFISFMLSSCEIPAAISRLISLLEKFIVTHSDRPKFGIVFAAGINMLMENLLIDEIDRKQGEKLIEKLEWVLNLYPATPEIAIEFAEALSDFASLFSPIDEEDIDTIVQTAECLKMLVQNYSDIPEIVIEYAKCLSLLTFGINEEVTLKALNQLRWLIDNYPNIAEVKVLFASGLVQSSILLDKDDMPEIVNQLKKFAEENQDNSDLMIKYVEGLANWAEKQNKDERLETLVQIENIYHQHSTIPEIVNLFAKELLMLSLWQHKEELQKTINKLEELVELHPNIPDLKVTLARILSFSIQEQDEKEVNEMVNRLAEFVDMYPDIPELVVEFAEGLVHLSCVQNEQGKQQTIMQLENLVNDYPDVPELLSCFIKGLISLSVSQRKPNEKKKTLNRLKVLVKNDLEIQEEIIEFIKRLAGLIKEDDEEEFQKTVKELIKICPDMLEEDEDISDDMIDSYEQDSTIRLANDLVDHILFIDEHEARNSIKQLERLVNANPGKEELIDIYAHGLVYLSFRQEKEGRLDIVRKMENLLSQHPEMPELSVQLAEILKSLMHEQNEQEAQKTLIQLENMTNTYSNISGVLCEFARGLGVLSKKQEGESKAATIARLEKYVEKHSDIPYMNNIFVEYTEEEPMKNSDFWDSFNIEGQEEIEED